MGALEIILILAGVAFLLCGYFLPEKLSTKELDKIAELSEAEIAHIVQKKLDGAKSHIENDLDDAMESSYEKIIRQMEKDSNEKIMAISEYSDSVLDSISKTHNEVMFLYSMLNDKYDELTTYANHLSTLKEDIMEMENSRENMAVIREDNSDAAEEEPVFEATEEVCENHNEQILTMYMEGKEPVDIARELGVGIGVVRLVLDLYKGDK